MGMTMLAVVRGKDSLIHKHLMMGIKGTAVGNGYIATASDGKVGSRLQLALLTPALCPPTSTTVLVFSHSSLNTCAVQGAAPQVDTNCQDNCIDVPYTTWQNDCKTITKTKTMCDIVYQQQCQKVCKPVCQKVTTVTTTQVGC
jgi:hypothetical protein